MNEDPQLHAVAALIGDPSRATMLLSLMGGRQVPASELARRAHVSPATASEHLAKLVSGGLLRTRVHGRYRYFQLMSPEVASVLEGLMGLAPPTPVRSLRQSVRTAQLHKARTCYDHLAGTLGTAITDALLQAGWLTFDPDTETFRVTPSGNERFAAWGLALPQQSRRPLVRACLDWSERRYHLAGQLGAALAHWMFSERWIVGAADGRMVHVTESGVAALQDHLGIRWPPDKTNADWIGPQAARPTPMRP